MVYLWGTTAEDGITAILQLSGALHEVPKRRLRIEFLPTNSASIWMEGWPPPLLRLRVVVIGHVIHVLGEDLTA
jgi:hypothetical protein